MAGEEEQGEQNLQQPDEAAINEDSQVSAIEIRSSIDQREDA